MQDAASPVRPVPWASIAALLIAAVAVAATLRTIDFPLGTIGDEWAKIDAVRTGNNRYYHPLFMIEVVQATNFFVHARDLQSIVELGRLCAAVFGGLFVFATFRLARLVLPDIPALAATAATAMVPLVSVHARIFKEDIFVTSFLLLALVVLIELLRAPSPWRAALLGVFAGLAAGSKYIGLLFIPFALAAIWFVPGPGTERRVKRMLTVAGIAALVLFLIEIPALRHLGKLQTGVSYELAHAAQGHDVPLPLSLTLGGLHLTQSLWPGLGIPLLILGLLGLAAPLIAPPERRMPLALIAGFSLLWYAVHEATPLKPYPDVSRYMLLLGPLLIVLATSFLYELAARRDRRGIVASVIVLAAAVPALLTSLRINGTEQDPRAVVPQSLAATGARIAIDRYADYDSSRTLLGDIALRPTVRTADILATANLTYDRFASYAARKDLVSRPTARYYRGLNALPHLDVSNGRPTFAYFNPVIRIVAMDGQSDRLKGIAAAIRAAAPDFEAKLFASDGGAETGRK